MSLLCSTCLSSDRKLIPLNKLKNDILINFDYFKIDEDMIVLICWECQAIFQKIHRFRIQAMKAQEFLLSNNDRNDMIKTNTKCLSQLNFYTKTIYDAMWRCTDEMKLDENTGSTKNGYLYVSNSDVDDVFNDDIDDTGLVLPKIVNCIGGTTKIDNDTLETDQIIYPIIVNNADNIGNNDDINDSTASNKDIGPMIDIEIGICPKSRPTFENTHIDEHGIKLTKDESKFLVTIMTEEEMNQTRQLDRNGKRYKTAPYKCKNCIKAFFDQNRYKKHMYDNHTEGVGKYKCSICSIYITRCDIHQQHYAMHYHRYRCRMCDYQDHRLSTMVLHHQKAHEAKTYPCNMCDQEFSTPRALRYHRETVHIENAICKICDKSYPKPSFKVHMISHKARVPCPDCGKLYKETSLRFHRKLHTRGTDEGAYCAECDMQFKDKGLYKRHIMYNLRHHGGDVKYICDYCNRIYTIKHNLRVHITSKHMQKFWYTCHICEKGFMGKSKLKMHVLEKHEGYQRPKDKLCPYCGRGFKDSSVLTNHIRRHTGERPHQCGHCSATFAQRITMITHSRALHPGLSIPPPKRGI